jgi:membrane-associated protein
LRKLKGDIPRVHIDIALTSQGVVILETLLSFMAILQDLPGYLTQLSAQMGPWIYVVLFLIIFAETGLIVTPFLPGDSLLFALGALSAVEGGLDLRLLIILLISAAVIGDNVNYGVGRWLGLRLFKNPNSKVFKPAYLKRTQDFYSRHGGKTLILARFLPIIRTYAPFVAGLGHMPYARFLSCSCIGGALWISIFLVAGNRFGNIPQVKTNFHYVIAAILVVSVMPAVIEFMRTRKMMSEAKVAEAKVSHGGSEQ